MSPLQTFWVPVLATTLCVFGCGAEPRLAQKPSVPFQVALEKPRTLRAKALAPDAIELTWTAPVPEVYAFVVEHRGPNFVTWVKLTHLPGTRHSFVHDGLKEATSHEYRVASVDKAGVLSPYVYTQVRSASSFAPMSGARIIPVIVSAMDTDPEDLDAQVALFTRMLATIRDWYSEELGNDQPGKTFRFEPVRVLQGHFSRDEWDDFGDNGFVLPDGSRTASDGECAMLLGAEHELTVQKLLVNARLPALGTPGVLYAVALGGGRAGACGKAGRLAAIPLSVLTDTQDFCTTGRYGGGAFDGSAADCRGPGTLAHELGHALGLPHCSDRPVCSGTRSLMDFWWEYDQPLGATLSNEDRNDLMRSAWMTLPL